MKIPGFLKKKRTYVILALLVGGVVWAGSRGNSNPQDKYETAVVEKGTLVRTVDVTGEITPAQRIDLAFESGGTVADIHVKVGDSVKAGQALAELQDADLSFAAARASANRDAARAALNLKIAGETPQSIRMAEAEVEKAQVNVTNTDVKTANAVKNAQLALETAQLNLKNEGATDDQAITDAYADLRLALVGSLGSVQTAMTDGDRIIGVDDTATYSTYRSVIGIGDSASLTSAQNTYKQAKTAKVLAESQIRALTDASSHTDITTAATTAQQVLSLLQSYLTDVQKVLTATIAGNGYSATMLASDKAAIDGDRASVSTQKTTVENAVQAAVNASLGQTTSREQLENKVRTATLDLEIAKSNAETERKTAQSNLTIAKATLELKKAGPREVDLAPLRASLAEAEVAAAQASNNLQKVRIIAPVDGVISELIPEKGEQMTANTPAIRMIGFADFDIEILLPEADVVKVKAGQMATITLDAYGDDTELSGTVVSEEPDQTLVQDAVYYKARVQINTSASTTEMEFKPGMTANVTILTAEAKDALIIPARAVRTDAATGKQSIRILTGTEPADRAIQTGLRGDEGRIQVTEGVTEGETVIVSERSS